MFDLTPNIKIDSLAQKKYAYARLALHVLFVATACFFAFKILFPTILLGFSLKTPNSIKNAELFPRLEQSGKIPESGKIAKNQNLIFNASPLGQYANVEISFTTKKGAPEIANSQIKINKSFQAMQYTEGEPVGFKDGTLLTTPANGKYFIISDGKIRRFANTDIILSLGYPKDAFLEISESDLGYNEAGSDIAEATYPNDTFFAVDQNYYRLENGQLLPFVSKQAYLSQFDEINSISKDKNIFKQFPVSENFQDFSDGTLTSFDDVVYVLSKNKSYPIMNSESFVFMGYAWENVLPINQAELGLYEKQKQYTPFQPHPDGTIFFDQNVGKYWLIENGQKRPIFSEKIAKNLSKQKMILTDSKGGEKNSTCSLEKKFLSGKTFECEASIKDLGPLLGNNFQFNSSFSTDTEIDNISVTFFTPISFGNMKYSLSQIKGKILLKWQQQ